MWSLIDFLFTVILIITLTLPIYITIKKSNKINSRKASICALFAPIAVVLNYVLCLNTEYILLHLFSVDPYVKSYIIAISSILISFVVFVICYLVFTKKLNCLPKLLFFVVPGTYTFFSIIKNIITAITAYTWGNTEHLYTVLGVVESSANIFIVLIWSLTSYFVMRNLIYKILCNTVDNNIPYTENKASKKAAVIISLFVPLYIIIYTYLYYISGYFAAQNGIETYLFYTNLYWAITEFLSFILCLGVFILLTKKFKATLPASLFFIAPGFLFARSLLINLMGLYFNNVEDSMLKLKLENWVAILGIGTIVIISYFVTKNIIHKLLNVHNSR